VAGLVEELLEVADALVAHPFGNFVFQCLLEQGTPATRKRLAEVLCRSAKTFARHWIASNVVRCALARCAVEDRARLARAIAPTAKDLVRLRQHRFGNFIAKELKNQASEIAALDCTTENR